MYTENYTTSTRNGTYGGTLLAILLQVNLPGLLNTVIIAAVGAATSFFVSVALRYISQKYFTKPAAKHKREPGHKKDIK